MKFVVLALGLVVAASIATYARYQSLDPCDWLERDMTRALDLPPFMAQARIRAGFLIQGIANPTSYDCLTEWWRLKSEGLREET